MKKLFFIQCLMLVAVLFSSCEKDEVTDNFLVGKWRWTFMSVIDKADGVVIEEESIDLTSGAYADYLMIWEFKEDGRLLTYSEEREIEFAYTLNDKGTKLTLDYVDDDYDVVWDVKKNSDTEIELSFLLQATIDGVVESHYEMVVLQKQ